MPRKKKDRTVWQQRFNLYSDNPDDVRLYAYLQKLAEDGDAADWIRKQLHKVVPSEYNHDTTVVQQVVPRNDEPEPPKEQPKPRNGSGPATPKGNVTVPPNYNRKPQPVVKIPAHIGRRTEE